MQRRSTCRSHLSKRRRSEYPLSVRLFWGAHVNRPTHKHSAQVNTTRTGRVERREVWRESRAVAARSSRWRAAAGTAGAEWARAAAGMARGRRDAGAPGGRRPQLAAGRAPRASRLSTFVVFDAAACVNVNLTSSCANR